MIMTVSGSTGPGLSGMIILLAIIVAVIYFTIIRPEERGAKWMGIKNDASFKSCVRFVKAMHLISRELECPSYVVFSADAAGDSYLIRIADGDISPFPQDYTALKGILSEERKVRIIRLMNRFGMTEETAQDADLSGRVVYQFCDQEGVIRFHADKWICSLKAGKKNHFMKALETMILEEIHGTSVSMELDTIMVSINRK